MSLLIVKTAGQVTAYPLEKIQSVGLYTSEGNDTHHATVNLRVDGRTSDVTLYEGNGEVSVIEEAETLYRKILNGMTGEKTVNLTDFALTQPKAKAKPKETPAEKEEATEEEAPDTENAA